MAFTCLFFGRRPFAESAKMWIFCGILLLKMSGGPGPVMVDCTAMQQGVYGKACRPACRLMQCVAASSPWVWVCRTVCRPAQEWGGRTCKFSKKILKEDLKLNWYKAI